MHVCVRMNIAKKVAKIYYRTLTTVSCAYGINLYVVIIQLYKTHSKKTVRHVFFCLLYALIIEIVPF